MSTNALTSMHQQQSDHTFLPIHTTLLLSPNTRIYSNTPYESKVGYCRIRRVGCFIYVSGTVACDKDGVCVGTNNIVKETQYILQQISNKLQEAGSSIHHVVRSRVFLTHMQRDFQGN